MIEDVKKNNKLTDEEKAKTISDLEKALKAAKNAPNPIKGGDKPA